MRYVCLILIAVIMCFANPAAAVGPVTALAGKYSVAVASEPSPPVTGENILIISVKDGANALTNAAVAVHIDMTSMPMPADANATPGQNAGEYGATVNFSMAGVWKVDVSVQQMAGMKMAGDGVAHFVVETGKGITAKSAGRPIPWFGIIVTVLFLGILVTVLVYRHLSTKSRGYLVGILTLAIVLVGTVVFVQKYRDAKTSTVLASANMDMSTQPAPGVVAVTTETVRAAPFHASATYTGSITPDREEDVYPRVTGRLLQMPFYPGDRVAPGQVVAVLDSTELAAKEAQARYGKISANQQITVANADIASAQAGYAKALKGAAEVRAQLAQVNAAARAADSAVKAAQSDVNNARQLANETEGAVLSAQSGIDQANEAVSQAQSDVESAQADVVYWTTEIAREKKLYEQGAVAREEMDRETAQAATANAKLSQVKAATRIAEAGVARAKQDYAQARARQGAAQAAIISAEARQEGMQASRDAAQGKITETQAAVATAEAEVSAATAGVTSALARAQVAATTAMQAGAVLTEANTVRGYTTIRSAVGGMVTARNISSGVLVQPGMSILKIAKIDVVRIQVNISEADLAQIQIGQFLTAHAVDRPEREITARISAIFPVRDIAARTAIVEARVANPGYQLNPGQYLSVQINLNSASRQVITVPTTALVTRDGESSVFLAKSDGMRTIARRSSVTVGRLSDDRTELLTGIHEGDAVISTGWANLHDGDAIKVLRNTVNAPESPLPPPAIDRMPAPSEPMPVITPAAGVLPRKIPVVRDPAPRQENASRTNASTTGAPTLDAKKWFHCPMHLDMVSNKPGKCPKCGMDYVEFHKGP